MDWHEYIERVPGVLQGKPIFRGTQITVESILERVDDGSTPESIAKNAPPLTLEHINAAVSYAHEVELNLKLQSVDDFDDPVHGELNPITICPNCQTRGKIRTKSVRRKGGVSDGKLVAALLTQGTSLLFTGLASTEQRTSAWCGECRNSWEF